MGCDVAEPPNPGPRRKLSHSSKPFTIDRCPGLWPSLLAQIHGEDRGTPTRSGDFGPWPAPVKTFEFCRRLHGFYTLSQPEPGFRQNVWVSGRLNRVPKSVWLSSVCQGPHLSVVFRRSRKRFEFREARLRPLSDSGSFRRQPRLKHTRYGTMPAVEAGIGRMHLGRWTGHRPLSPLATGSKQGAPYRRINRRGTALRCVEPAPDLR